MASDILIYPHEAAILRKAQIDHLELKQQEEGPLWSVVSNDIEKIEEVAKRVLAQASELKPSKPLTESSGWSSAFQGYLGTAQKYVEYATATGEQGSTWKLGTDLTTLAKELKVRHTNPSWLDTLADYLRITLREQEKIAPWNIEFYLSRLSTEQIPPPSHSDKRPNPPESVQLYSHEAQMLQLAQVAFAKSLNSRGEPVFAFWGDPKSLESRAAALESEITDSTHATLLNQGLQVVNLDPQASKRTLIQDLRTLSKEIRARRIIPDLVGQMIRYNLITSERLKTPAEANFYSGNYRNVEVLFGG